MDEKKDLKSILEMDELSLKMAKSFFILATFVFLLSYFFVASWFYAEIFNYVLKYSYFGFTTSKSSKTNSLSNLSLPLPRL